MTREEAIQWLKNALTSPLMYGEYAEALNMAISALSVIDIVDLTNGNTITKAEYEGEPSDLMSHEEAWKHIESDLISRADAIKAINNGFCACVSDCIDEINKLPNAGTECTDFIHWISRVVTDDELWELNAVGYGEIICRKLVKIGALATTEKPPYYYVPSVSAEPKRGEWITKERTSTDGAIFFDFYCDQCCKWSNSVSNFCPNCGAKMKGGTE